MSSQARGGVVFGAGHANDRLFGRSIYSADIRDSWRMIDDVLRACFAHSPPFTVRRRQRSESFSNSAGSVRPCKVFGSRRLQRRTAAGHRTSVHISETVSRVLDRAARHVIPVSGKLFAGSPIPDGLVASRLFENDDTFLSHQTRAFKR